MRTFDSNYDLIDYVFEGFERYNQYTNKCDIKRDRNFLVHRLHQSHIKDDEFNIYFVINYLIENLESV